MHAYLQHYSSIRPRVPEFALSRDPNSACATDSSALCDHIWNHSPCLYFLAINLSQAVFGNMESGSTTKSMITACNRVTFFLFRSGTLDREQKMCPEVKSAVQYISRRMRKSYCLTGRFQPNPGYIPKSKHREAQLVSPTQSMLELGSTVRSSDTKAVPVECE